MTGAVELLCRVEGIGEERVEHLVETFGSGRGVAKAAASAWGRIAEVDGVSEDLAQDLFYRMHDAGVYDTLKSGGQP